MQQESSHHWQPISENRLAELIEIGEASMPPRDLAFWSQIRVRPTKWILSPWGDLGGGFWVVAVWGSHCIWFNDIEGGFNLGRFDTFGVLGDYTSGQAQLHECVSGANFYLQLRNAE